MCPVVGHELLKRDQNILFRKTASFHCPALQLITFVRRLLVGRFVSNRALSLSVLYWRYAGGILWPLFA